MSKKEQIILAGMGGHAKSVVDSIEQQNSYLIEGFVEKDRNSLKRYRGYGIIGTDLDFERIFNKGIVSAFISVGYLGHGETRSRLFEKLKHIGYQIPSIVDKTAIVATDVIIGAGTYVGKGAIINSNSSIGEMCIINSAAIIEHECIVGEYSHVAVGATICGGCHIGKGTFIGANATIIQGVNIGNNVIIGAGAVVLRDVTDNKTVVGIFDGYK